MEIKNATKTEKIQYEGYEESRQIFNVCKECGCLEWTEKAICYGCGAEYSEETIKRIECAEGDIWKRELGSMSDGSYRVIAYYSDTYNKNQ